MRQLANAITISRIVISIIMLAFEPFTFPFSMLYIYCGVSDMIDGTIARKAGTADKRGALLDSVADIVFVMVSAVKVIPAMELKIWMWIWIGVITFIKGTNLLSGWMCQKKMVMLHTVVNKITGFLIFLWVIVIKTISLNISLPIVCAVATFSAIQEGHFIRTGRNEE